MPTADYSVLRDEVTAGKTETVTDTGSATSDVSISGTNANSASINSTSKDVNSESVPEKGTSQSDIKFGVGMSQEWDPYKAGVQATSKALEQVGYKPKFLLIFSTIHYATEKGAKKKGGLKAMLKGCRDLVDKKLPSIGGTVTGFICPEGCSTRGCVVVAGAGDGMDIAGGYANNVRRAPIMAGKKIAKSIKEQLSNSTKENKLLIEFTTGAKEPKIMTYDIIRNLSGKLPNKVWWSVRDILNEIVVKYFNEGQGMEGAVLDAVGENLEDYYIIGAPTFDDLGALRNYQFYNAKVLEGGVVGLGITSNNPILADRRFPPIPTGKKFKIKRGWGNFWIDQVDGQPAAIQFFKEIGWPPEYAKTHIVKLMSKTYFQVLGFEHEGVKYAFPLGFFFGKSILTNIQIKKDEIELFLTSTKRILSILDDYFKYFDSKKQHMSFMFGTPPIIGMFGANIWKIKEVLDSYHNNLPYLVLFGAGELFKRPNDNAIFSDYSLVMLSI